MSDLKTYLSRKRRRVEDALRRLLPGNVPKRLDRSMRYSLFSPGKRLRPVLVVASCEALGGRERDALPAACAVEMIHAYSLIHDDLPAMDDDDFRRGRPSNHRAFDEATAILAGDGLLTAAFEVIARGTRDERVAARLVRELAEGAGPAGMVGGQMLDLRQKASLEEIHRRKTAALFRASTRMGAVAAKASPASLRKLGDYGLRIGLAFQAVDDILDHEGNLKEARRRALRATKSALKSIAFLGKRGAFLRQLAEYLITRTY